jgi:uncharacterized membrane protein HdeD (DUF308 family)
VGTALLDVILGVLILAWPGVSLATLAVLFAISLLAQGAFAIVFALRLRREQRSAVATTRGDIAGVT